MRTTKADRQAAIRAIVRAAAIGSQAELRKVLRTRGMAVDQSTLSRDLEELAIRKARGRYVLPAPAAARVLEPEYSASVVGFFPCGPHIIVVRTTLGAAQPLAVKIDRTADASIAATLAGDDTIFVATKSRRCQAVALRRLQQWFGDKYER